MYGTKHFIVGGIEVPLLIVQKTFSWSSWEGSCLVVAGLMAGQGLARPRRRVLKGLVVN